MFPIHMMQSWNQMCDSQFYDVGALTEEEHTLLSKWSDPEGSVVVVYPSSDHRIPLQYTLDEFISELLDAQLPVRNIVMAGVGSSALGTAALARNVADYIGEPVCGIVSGLGMTDIISEGMGGWYALGARNIIRDWITRSLTMTNMFWGQKATPENFPDTESVPEHFLRGCPESTSLLKILLAAGKKIKLVVGHSKANYSIENAIEGYVAHCRYRGKEMVDFQIVTLGALVHFPEEMKRVKQVIGGMDLFGTMNSRPYLAAKIIPLASHTTNPQRPFPLLVSHALEVAGVVKKFKHPHE